MDHAIQQTAILPAPLVTRLSSYVPLRADDFLDFTEQLPDLRLHASRDELLDDPEAARLVIGGWAGVTRGLSDGRRQILHVAIPGDIVRAPVVPDGAVSALTVARSVDARPLLQWLKTQPATSAVVRAWRLSLADHQRLLCEQIVRLGAMTAYERAANFIVELLLRHQRAGLGDGQRFPWRVTQEVVADVLGLSMVHVNRVLQQLRHDKMIELRSGLLIVANPHQLAAAGFVSQGELRSEGPRAPRASFDSAENRIRPKGLPSAP